MKLERVEFEDFKSICQGSLDIEEGITTLVGINESGKSNVLFALEKSDKKKKLENYDIRKNSERVYDEKESPKLKLQFTLNSREKEALIGYFGFTDTKDLPKIVLSKENSNYALDYPKINYDKSSFGESFDASVDESPLIAIDQDISQNSDAIASKKKELVDTKEENTKNQIIESIKDLSDKKNTLQEKRNEAQSKLEIARDEKIKGRNSKIRESLVDKITKEFLPKVLFFDSVAIDNFYLPLDGRVEIEKLIATPGKYKQIINLLSLGGITNLETLKAGDTRKNDLRKQKLNQASTKINSDVLRKHWPLEDVEFVLSIEETNTLAIHLREKGDDSMFVPGDRSRGLQWSIAFNIYFLSESKGGDLRNAILLIDEPGIFLHIDAQKKLLEETFPEILKGDNQIIYTTHLPYLIHPKFPERIRILEKESRKGETSIGNKAWSEGRVSEIPEPVKTALGTKWTEWFGVGDDCCMVEGPSDQVILRSLIGKVSGNESYIPVYGKLSIPSALALSKIDGKNSIAIVDNDLSEKEKTELESKLELVDIPKDTLNSLSKLSGSDDVVTIEDIIPEFIYIEAVDRVYGYKLNQLSEGYKKTDIPAQYPRINTFKKYIEQLSGQKGHAFKKMEIARAVADITNGLETPAQNNPKWTVIRRISKNIDSLLADKKIFKSSKEENKKESKST